MKTIYKTLANYGSRRDTLSGAAAVIKAISDAENRANKDHHATLGEPGLIKEDSASKPKVEVPVDEPFDSIQRLIFDLPTPSTDGNSPFVTLLERFNLGLDTMAELNGKEVPIKILNGNVHVLWTHTNTESKNREGGEKDRNVENTVNVSKTTISPGPEND